MSTATQEPNAPAVPTEGLVETLIEQTVTILPEDFGPDMKGLATRRFKESLLNKPEVIQVLDVVFLSPAMVLPSYGHVTYRMQARAITFEPSEGLIAPAKIIDVKKQGVKLKMHFLVCYLPEPWLKRQKAQIVPERKCFIRDGQVYQINSTIMVRIEGIREKASQLEAVVDLVIDQ